MSAFQKRIRGGATVLSDHICKEMNPLNLERCRCIPTGVPGADWRVLQQIVAEDPSREKFQACCCLKFRNKTNPAWAPLFCLVCRVWAFLLLLLKGVSPDVGDPKPNWMQPQPSVLYHVAGVWVS